MTTVPPLQPIIRELCDKEQIASMVKLKWNSIKICIDKQRGGAPNRPHPREQRWNTIKKWISEKSGFTVNTKNKNIKE